MLLLCTKCSEWFVEIELELWLSARQYSQRSNIQLYARINSGNKSKKHKIPSNAQILMIELSFRIYQTHTNEEKQNQTSFCFYVCPNKSCIYVSLSQRVCICQTVMSCEINFFSIFLRLPICWWLMHMIVSRFYTYIRFAFISYFSLSLLFFLSFRKPTNLMLSFVLRKRNGSICSVRTLILD